MVFRHAWPPVSTSGYETYAQASRNSARRLWLTLNLFKPKVSFAKSIMLGSDHLCAFHSRRSGQNHRAASLGAGVQRRFVLGRYDGLEQRCASAQEHVSTSPKLDEIRRRSCGSQRPHRPQLSTGSRDRRQQLQRESEPSACLWLTGLSHKLLVSPQANLCGAIGFALRKTISPTAVPYAFDYGHRRGTACLISP